VNGDRLTRWTAVAAVLAVAAVAALISYKHAIDVVTVHGEPGIIGRLYPVVIDGLIVAASMVLLDASRHRESAPPLAWWMLAAGIGATLAVNVLAGVPSGWLAALIASWPALAFVGCYELLMLLVRASARRAVSSAVGATGPEVQLQQVHPAGAPEPAPRVHPRLKRTRIRNAVADADAEMHFAADLAAGQVPSVRRIQRELHVGQPRAKALRQQMQSVVNSRTQLVE
jgi:hypothetical protein